jgi:hypothetical protein
MDSLRRQYPMLSPLKSCSSFADIQFWRTKKNMEGLSFRTIVMNVVFQFIIFLYLLDNETSWMILISSGIGLVIEIWKINKTVNIKVSRTLRFIPS